MINITTRTRHNDMLSPSALHDPLILILCSSVLQPDIRESLLAAADTSMRRGTASAFCFGCGAGAADQDELDDVVHHFSKIHTDQLVEAHELEVD